MFDRELTIGLSGVRRIIPTKLGISRPTLTTNETVEKNPKLKISYSVIRKCHIRLYSTWSL
jgi:DNA-binding XRE family transcriptional regulator